MVGRVEYGIWTDPSEVLFEGLLSGLGLRGRRAVTLAGLWGYFADMGGILGGGFEEGRLLLCWFALSSGS